MSRIGSWLSSLVGSSGSKKADEAPQMPEGDIPLVTGGKTETVDPETARKILAEIEDEPTNREQAAASLQKPTMSREARIALRQKLAAQTPNSES